MVSSVKVSPRFHSLKQKRSDVPKMRWILISKGNLAGDDGPLGNCDGALERRKLV